ncbi:hypothetical protein [Actinophytocola sp.]|uniref:hypothetical protein n=1 Tax=Actinophytocola sp. TaxID=1872138 RepID=UPI002ED1A610
MTYPPQGPYGQQPDPYGQQQPQYGGYPQQQPQQPQYGGYDPNAQYGGGYGQQYGGLGGGPQPPKKTNKGPIIAVVSIVVLILAGVGITGFVAPGFFLSDKGSDAAGGSTTSGKKDTGAEAFIEKLVAAADDKDKSALKDLQCSDASDGVTGATNAIDEITSADLKEISEQSDTKAIAILTIKVDGETDDYETTVVKDGGKWCWQDITNGAGGSSNEPTEESTSEDDTASSDTAEPPAGGATGDSEGEQFVQSFLDKLNGGDGAGAAAMSCSDSTSQTDITDAAAKGAQLQMVPEGTTADSSYVGADLKGTLAGEAAEGRTSAFLEDGAWCIYTFFAY